MKELGVDLNVDNKVILLDNGNVFFSKEMGVTLYYSGKPLGIGAEESAMPLL